MIAKYSVVTTRNLFQCFDKYNLENCYGRYLVVVTIENKDQVGDPEGETIKKDLILEVDI